MKVNHRTRLISIELDAKGLHSCSATLNGLLRGTIPLATCPHYDIEPGVQQVQGSLALAVREWARR